MEATISLEQYEDALIQLAKNRVKHLFYNEGNDHALIVFKTIFNNAKKDLYIVANDLTNAEVSNAPDYIEGLRSFLAQDDVRLNIMLTNFNNAGAAQLPVFQTIYESQAYKDNRINIFCLNGKTFRSGDEIIHFCFADGQMYRIETDIQRRKATGNFNDPETAGGLLDKFNIGIALDTTTKVELSKVFQE